MASVTSLEDRRLRGQQRRPPLRVLLSAYACEPDRGSEPGIGWQWATRLAELGHEIHVITRANNREAIERACASKSIPTLHFSYFDLPKWASFWKRGGRGVHLYYLLWQLFSYRVASRLHRTHKFDVVHHLTFGVFRQPSMLGFLDAPFIFGPVGGGERAPPALRRCLPTSARRQERLRDLANLFAQMDPLLRSVLRRSDRILCKTRETLECIPKLYREQCEIFLELGADHSISPAQSISRLKATTGLRVLYVGRLIHMKGVHLALPAFKRLLEEFPESKFTLAGGGPQEQELRTLARDLDIEANVEWLGWVPRDQLRAIYSSHDVFLFPSLHDSSGNAVLEAMTAGVPVVCLNLGGPAAIVDAFSGITVEATEPLPAIQRLGDALTLLARRPELRVFLSHGAQARANHHFSWHNQISRMNALYYELQPATSRQVLQ
jgi:glycosyltransferase involved in cell wall biosynthesis